MKLTETITVDNLDVKVAPDLHTRLRWKEYQILSLLVKNSPKAVTRGEFVNQIWKGTYCSDSTINQTIKSIRKKIGDKEHEIIKTVPRVGCIIEEKHRFDMHSSPPYTLPVSGADSQAGRQQPPHRTEQASAAQPVPRVIDETYMDPSDHAEPVWALPAHAKTPADLYQDAYTDKSLQGMGVWRYLFSLTQRLYYQKRKIVLLSRTICILMATVLTYLMNKHIPLTGVEDEKADWQDLSTLSATCSVNDNPLLLHYNSCIGATGGLEDAYFYCNPSSSR